MTVYAFYIKRDHLSDGTRSTMLIDMEQDRILEKEFDRGVILYAWTLDKKIATEFQKLRSRKFYKKRLEFESEKSSEYEGFYKKFSERELYRNKLVTRNTNLAIHDATIDIPMIMTTFEAQHVDIYWEGLDEDLYGMIFEQPGGDRLLYNIYKTLKPEYQKALDILNYTNMLDEVSSFYEQGKFEHGIILDEFNIFMDVYGETFC